jgi:hypothetical protein
MKIIDDSQLNDWAAGADTEFHFVVVKTPTCVKCEKLSKNQEAVFGEMTEKVAWFVFKPGSQAGSLLQEAGAMSAPSVLYRYFDNGWHVAKIEANFDDDYTDAGCIFDALAAKDFGFFGYNEYGEVIYPGDEDPKMNALLREIWGVNQAAINERNKLKAEVTN